MSFSCSARSANKGACESSAAEIPVIDSMIGSISHSGFTSDWKVSTTFPCSTLTMPISMMRLYAGLVPVVSVSTIAKVPWPKLRLEDFIVIQLKGQTAQDDHRPPCSSARGGALCVRKDSSNVVSPGMKRKTVMNMDVGRDSSPVYTVVGSGD